MNKNTTPPSEFEPEFVAGIRSIFEDKMAFNKVLGLNITSLQPKRVTARIDKNPRLLARHNSSQLHGGVISAGLDTVGGLACMAAIGALHMDESPEQRLHRFIRLSTIDLHVDYLLPCDAESIEFSAEVLRLGNRVASTRMELRGEDGKLFSVASGAYTVS